MKAFPALLALALTGCVSITKHNETELQLAACREQLELSGYHRIEAPKAATGMAAVTTALILVTADQVHVNGDALPAAGLSTRLEEIRDEDPDTRLIVNADPDVPYGKVIEALDQARLAGFSEYHLGVGPPSPVLAGEE